MGVLVCWYFWDGKEHIAIASLDTEEHLCVFGRK